MDNKNIPPDDSIVLPITLIVTPQTISSNEQAVLLSRNMDLSNNNHDLQLALETVFLNSVLKINLDKSILENLRNEMESNQIPINILQNTGKRYNVKRSTNVPEYHKMPKDTRTIQLARIPIQYNIMATNSLYNKLSIFDQGDLGSCVSNALSFIYSLLEYKQGNYINITPSRLFIYYNGRVIEKTVQIDNGLEIYDGISTMKKNGVCDEKLWPYVISRFATKPSVICYQKAMSGKVISITPIAQTLIALQTAISSGLPIVIGIDVYSSFENRTVSTTGIVPMPNINTETLLGGHCVVLIAYNNANRLFTFRNSWGRNWGAAGNGYLPYAYVTNSNLAFDFYTINMVTNPRII